MQATINGDGVIIEAEHGGGPRVIITFKDGVVINQTLAADFGVRLLGGVGPRGPQGATGTTFTPSVDSSGNISWTNDGGKTNPQTRNIKGPQGDSYVLTAQDKQDIADLVQAAIDLDTGWVDISSYADTTVITPTASRFHIRKIGKVVHLRIRFTLVGQLASNTSLTITSALPSAYRPETTCRFLCTASNEGGMWLDVQADGTLRTYSRNVAVAANGYLSGDVVYTVDAPVSE